MIPPYLCTDSHRDNSILLVPVNSADTRPIGEIGCHDGISSPDSVDAFTIGQPDADSPAGVTLSPPPGLRSCCLRCKEAFAHSYMISIVIIFNHV